MHKRNSSMQPGFTIVELLIVIVVIAILAAISVVTYSGFANRAHDSAVKSDLHNLAALIREYKVTNGRNPAGHIALGAGSGFGAIQGIEAFSFAKGSYITNVNNIYYCETSGVFAVGAVSKSSNRFFYTEAGGLVPYTGPWTNADNICPAMLGTSANITQSYGFRGSDDAWSPMAK